MGDSGALTFIDTATRRATARPGILPGLTLGAPLDDLLRFSDDGSLLAVAGSEPRVLDGRTGRLIARLRTAWPLSQIRFAPGGRSVFALGGPLRGGLVVQRIDARTGLRLAPDRRIGAGAAGGSLAVMSDGGELVASAEGGGTTILDARTLNPLRRLAPGAAQAALSPDDRTLVLGGRDGSVRFLDLSTGAVRTASGRHDGAVVRVVFGADGRTAASAGDDNRVIVWDARRAQTVDTLVGHAGQVTALAISPDGGTLYSAALDGRAIVWDLAGDRRFGRRFATGPGDPDEAGGYRPLAYAVRPGGDGLAVGHDDGSVTLVDLPAGTRARLRVMRRAVTALGYVPGTGLLAVGGVRGALILVDPATGRRAARLPGHREMVVAPAFSADGRLMVTLSVGDVVQLWRLRAGIPVGRPRSYFPSGFAADVSLSPDGRRLAVTSVLGIQIVDVATLRVVRSLATEQVHPASARFSPDGRLLAVGSFDRWAQAWSTRTWRPVTPRLTGHTGDVGWVSVSPDGRTLATGGTDGTVRLFDIPTGQALGAPLPVVPNRPVAPAFTPDGAYLLALTNTGAGWSWDVRPSAWARQACAVAGRRLTHAEWDDVLPGRPYAPAC